MSYQGTASEHWDSSRSYGNVPIVQTHETLNEGTTYFHTRFWCAAFLIPNGLTAVVFPVFPHNKETFSHISHRAKIRQMGPHTHQGPHATAFTRSTKMDFDMEWFALMYSIDASVMLTSSADFIRGQQMQLLASAVNLTLTHKIVESILNLPDIYSLYEKMLKTGVQQRYSEDTIQQLVMDLKERTPGFIGGQGSALQAIDRNADMYHSLAPSIASFLMFADELLHAMKVDDSMVPNFFMVGASTARSMNVTLTAERLPSFNSSRAITAHLNRENKTEDISMAAMKAVMLGQLTHGISLIPIDPIREDTGTINLLAKQMTTGLAYPVRIYYLKYFFDIIQSLGVDANEGSDYFHNHVGFSWPTVVMSIPDFERRQNVNITFQHPLSCPKTYNETELLPENFKYTIPREASAHIAWNLHHSCKRNKLLTANAKTYDLRILMFSAQNKFALASVDPDDLTSPGGEVQTYISRLDSFNNIVLAHYRMFYHTLDLDTSEFSRYIFEISNRSHEFKRISSIAEFQKRYKMFFNATPKHSSLPALISTADKISEDQLAHNTFIYNTFYPYESNLCFRDWGSRTEAYEDYTNRSRNSINVIGEVPEVQQQAEDNRKCFLNAHDELQEPLRGGIFNCVASAFQFMLDVLFITDLCKNNRTYVFPPSVSVEWDKSKFYNVPALPNYEIIDIVQAKIVISTEAIVYGIGGEDTGVVALGQQKVSRFTVPNEQHEETHMLIRAAVAIKEPNHLVVVPDAAYRGYISGASSRLYGPHSFSKDYANSFSDKGSTSLRRSRSNKSDEADMVAIVAPAFTSNSDSATLKLDQLVHEIGSTSRRDLRLYNTGFTALVSSDIQHWRGFQNINSPMANNKLYLPYAYQIDLYDAETESNTEKFVLLFGNRMSEELANTTINTVTIQPIVVAQKSPTVDVWRHVPYKSTAITSMIPGDNPHLRELKLMIEKMQEASVNEHVSRGPLRYITHETGMDTFCGRASTPTAHNVIVTLK